MASVSQLGYVGVGTSDTKAWQNLATNILGMEVVPGGDRATSYLRMDEYHHRFGRRSGDRDDIEFAGWEVADRATHDRWPNSSRTAASVTRAPVTGRRRRVIDLIKCVDSIDRGLLWPAGQPAAVPSTRAMTGFKTGDMGLGPSSSTLQPEETVRYRDPRSRVSDFTEVPRRAACRLAFLHQSSTPLVAIPETPDAPKRINHIMLECSSSTTSAPAVTSASARRAIAVDLGALERPHGVLLPGNQSASPSVRLGRPQSTSRPGRWSTTTQRTASGGIGLRNLIGGGRRAVAPRHGTGPPGAARHPRKRRAGSRRLRRGGSGLAARGGR